MNIEAFRIELRKRGIGPGARWRRADFHVHLPGSSDYEYREADANARLGTALEEGRYEVAVVVKHQEVPSRAELDTLQLHCPSVTLIPGAEINLLVDALFKKVGKDYFFHAIVAVDPAAGGDYSYILRKAQETLLYRGGDYPAGFRSSVVEVGRFFRDNGALFIAAHLHQGKAPEVSKSIDDLYEDDAFLGFVQDGAFDALEVRQRSTARFFEGGRSTAEGLLIPSATCVSSSDAHHHDHLVARKRDTWLRMEHTTLAELRAALSFSHRVRLDRPSLAYPRILGLHIVGSFIPNMWIELNESLNSLIGSKGSGKTAILECVRFGLNTPVPSERVKEVGRHLEHVLGASGYVECLVAMPGDVEMLITRRADSPDRITCVDASGNARVLSALDDIGFPISILGWHEIEAIADKATARIALLDRVGDRAAIQRRYDEMAQIVERARDQLPVLQRQIKRLDSALRDLWELQRKRATLLRLEQGALLTLQTQYEWFLLSEQKLAGLQSAAERRQLEVPESVAGRISIELGPLPALGPGADVITARIDAVRQAIVKTEAAETTATGSLQAALNEVHDMTKAARDSLAEAFGRFREDTYNPQVNALPPGDREILAKQIQVLEETKRLPLVQQQAEELSREVKGLSQELETFCESICAARDGIVQIRQGLVDSLNADLTSIRLAFRRSANHEARDRFQGSYGPEGAAIVKYVQGFGNVEAYQNLRALFSKLGQLDISADRWEVNDVLWDVKLVDLLRVVDEDDIDIALSVGKAGFVPIQNLSAGQRCVAVFPLLLRNSRGPLIIDQPEDNLDNRHIADAIAPDLLRRKALQQFAVTSHNANLVVLTDADLIVHVDSDGATIGISSAGFLSCSESPVRQSVLDVLDGGDGALRARQRKYGMRSE